ncbi:BRO-N domain-containing protein [Azotobacter beijerinckii]|uniref:BRO-N domain-containing protein n=1 Tax=Azotobacter beijerinckii TaxID=170623 RepID=UPI0029541D11|nr:Bro-N domain-containing protein [Azotobacter beijerinckii]MDV7209895.1 Bro-N domain-containing protein [Azotobacter beijerinckii]
MSIEGRLKPEKTKPRRAGQGFEEQRRNYQETNVMTKNTTAAANVIPFDFGKKPVRAILIDDQPWFVAADVSAALEYRDAGNMARNLDEDEKGTQIVSTLGGDQEMLVINESGLYSAILRSRKAEAKRFKKWVTSEVLPAIRKHGRYEDAGGKMGTLLDAVGVSELTALNGVIRQKAAIVRKDRRRSFIHTMHSRLHTRFNVRRTELILAKDFEAACNFVAAYAIEGEWMGKEPEPSAKAGTFADILGRPMTPDERWLIYTDHAGNEQHKPVPSDACVLSHRDLIKGMLSDIPVSTEDMFEFAMAVVANLKIRHDHQASLVKAGRVAA